MVVAALKMDWTVVTVVAVPLEVVPVAMAMVAVTIPLVVMVMPGAVLVPLRGGHPGEQHEGSCDHSCDAELQRRNLLVRDAPDCAYRLEPALKPGRSLHSAKGAAPLGGAGASAP